VPRGINVEGYGLPLEIDCHILFPQRKKIWHFFLTNRKSSILLLSLYYTNTYLEYV